MVYFILTLVVDTNFGLACDRPTDWLMDDIPLPAKNVSWMAKDKIAWRSTFDKTPPLHQNLTFGHLCNNRAIHQGQIEAWQEASGEMGLIVAMASHLKAAAEHI